jgi:hypothetical protein
MDGQRFDRLTVALAGGVSRRTVLRALLGGLLGGVAGGHTATAARGKDRVVICHRSRGGAKTRTITVAAPAVAAHLSHGDTIGECEEDLPFCAPSQWCNTSAGLVCCTDTGTVCCGGPCCAGEACCYDEQTGTGTCCLGGEASCCGGTCCPEGWLCLDPFQRLCIPYGGAQQCGETFCDRNADECCHDGQCVSGEPCFG